MLLMIDNYDSFTYNLYQYFCQLGVEVEVHRNDQISLAEIADKAPSHLVISPGPCSPNEAGISLAAVAEFAGKLPLLGVCLGHQCIAQHFGAKVSRAELAMHGKVRPIRHNGSSLFAGLPEQFEVTRYHSLIVEERSLPKELQISAWSAPRAGEAKEPEIMGLYHPEMNLHSVQFHPESIMTEHGLALLKNFVFSIK